MNSILYQLLNLRNQLYSEKANCNFGHWQRDEKECEKYYDILQKLENVNDAIVKFYHLIGKHYLNINLECKYCLTEIKLCTELISKNSK